MPFWTCEACAWQRAPLLGASPGLRRWPRARRLATPKELLHISFDELLSYIVYQTDSAASSKRVCWRSSSRCCKCWDQWGRPLFAWSSFCSSYTWRGHWIRETSASDLLSQGIFSPSDYLYHIPSMQPSNWILFDWFVSKTRILLYIPAQRHLALRTGSSSWCNTCLSSHTWSCQQFSISSRRCNSSNIDMTF